MMPFLTAGTGGPVPRNGVMGSERRNPKQIVNYSEGIVGPDLPEARRPTPGKSDYRTSAVLVPQMSG